MSSTRPRLLLVEDDTTMRLFLERLFADTYAVTSATDGAEGLRRVRAGKADLVVLDLGIPGLDGFDFIEAVRADTQFDRLPILVLSAREESADRVRCLRLGADDYLVKPFNPDELRARLANLLRRLA
jgi:DNA-binding response OmpR family regulator